MPLHVSTVGLEVPDDFPQKPYDAVHARVNSSPRDAEAMFHYGGAWNAVVYRFVSCARSDETFADSVRIAGSMPCPPQRFIQEDALFGFFVNGLSVIESFFYGLYWIGSMVDTNSFPVLTEDKPITPPIVHRQGVKPKRLKDINVYETVDQYIKIFGTCPLTDAFGGLRYRDSSGNAKPTSEYRKWKRIRNILAHHAAYGRAITITFGGHQEEAIQEEAVWRVLGEPLNDQLTSTRRQWLASTLAELMNGAEIFVGSHL